MRKAKDYVNEAVSVGPDASVMDVADQMDAHGVGCVVVVDGEDRPLGLVTDRDLTLRVVAAGRDPGKTDASEVMSTDLLCCGRRDSSLDVLKKLEARGVRRAPVVEGGHVVGIVSFDDLIVDLGAQLWNVAEAVRVELRETRRETRSRRRQELRGDLLHDLRQQIEEIGGQLRERVEGVLRRG
jgi:CBS domain-containing protein